MILSYFLTGSLLDSDNDFELTIRKSGEDTDNPKCTLRLEDLTSPEKLCWESLPADFMDCLFGLSGFIDEKRIRFYGKNPTSSTVDPIIDRQLQDFIYGSMPEHL